MNDIEPHTRSTFGRRDFLAIAGGVSLLPLLTAGGSVFTSATADAADLSSTGLIKFWDGILGTGAYNTLSKKLVQGYKPPKGQPKAAYQVITAANLFEAFQAAIAAGTGPAVSGGYAFQAFQFENEGAILYADKLVETLKKDGIYQDYVANSFEPFKTKKGYVAVPWGMDIRVWWVNKALLAKAGADIPTDWDSLLAAGKALKKIGVIGAATAAGSGAAFGGHMMVSMMINNGGGLFDEDGKPNCTYERNVEAMDFVREMVAAGMVDPASVSYSNNNLYSQFASQQAGMGIVNATLPAETGITNGDLVVPAPLKGPHGNTGTLEYLKNFMMYTNTPSDTGSASFLKWWLQQFAGSGGLFAKGVTGSLPIRKSVIKLPQIQSDPNVVKILKEWQPVAKGYSARGETLFAGLASVDAGTAVNAFTQTMLAGKTDSKSALQTLQAGIKSVMA